MNEEEKDKLYDIVATMRAELQAKGLELEQDEWLFVEFDGQCQDAAGKMWQRAKYDYDGTERDNSKIDLLFDLTKFQVVIKVAPEDMIMIRSQPVTVKVKDTKEVNFCSDWHNALMWMYERMKKWKLERIVQERLDALKCVVEEFCQSRGFELTDAYTVYFDNVMDAETMIKDKITQWGDSMIIDAAFKRRGFWPQHDTEIILKTQRWALRTYGRLALLEKAFDEMLWTATDRQEKDFRKSIGTNNPPCAGACMTYHAKGSLLEMLSHVKQNPYKEDPF